jgi:predicted transposase YbfD/YdcC
VTDRCCQHEHLSLHLLSQWHFRQKECQWRRRNVPADIIHQRRVATLVRETNRSR